jgi:hypothetical protein
VKDNALFAHGAQFGGLLDAGSVDVWFEAFHIHDSSDTECPDGQHMLIPKQLQASGITGCYSRKKSKKKGTSLRDAFYIS